MERASDVNAVFSILNEIGFKKVFSCAYICFRCHMPECSSASICGQLDRHGNEKKEVQELGKRKLKAEGELKALKADLSVKQTLSKNVSQSFEARIHDALIRTNPGKYLTENNRPKEGVILADTYILKNTMEVEFPMLNPLN